MHCRVKLPDLTWKIRCAKYTKWKVRNTEIQKYTGGKKLTKTVQPHWDARLTLDIISHIKDKYENTQHEKIHKSKSSKVLILHHSHIYNHIRFNLFLILNKLRVTEWLSSVDATIEQQKPWFILFIKRMLTLDSKECWHGHKMIKGWHSRIGGFSWPATLVVGISVSHTPVDRRRCNN